MALTLFLAATLRKYFPDYDPAFGRTVEIRSEISIRDLVRQLDIPEEEIKLIMVNGVAAKWDHALQGDERVALFPPVGGG